MHDGCAVGCEIEFSAGLACANECSVVVVCLVVCGVVATLSLWSHLGVSTASSLIVVLSFLNADWSSSPPSFGVDNARLRTLIGASSLTATAVGRCRLSETVDCR